MRLTEAKLEDIELQMEALTLLKHRNEQLARACEKVKNHIHKISVLELPREKIWGTISDFDSFEEY